MRRTTAEAEAAYLARLSAIRAAAAVPSHTRQLPVGVRSAHLVLAASGLGPLTQTGGPSSADEARLTVAPMRGCTISALEDVRRGQTSGLAPHLRSSPYLLSDFCAPSPQQRVAQPSAAAELWAADGAATHTVTAYHRTRQLRPPTDWMAPPSPYVAPASSPSRALASARRSLRDASNFYASTADAGSAYAPRPATAPPARGEAACRAHQQQSSDIFGHSLDSKGHWTVRASRSGAYSD